MSACPPPAGTAYAEEVRSALTATCPGSAGRWRIEVVDETTSTQDLCRRMAEAGERGPAAAMALFQTGGRGRRGRRWWSAPGAGLYLSALVRPVWPPSDAGWLPVLAVLALAIGLEKRGLTAARIKPPNDLVTPRGKLAGVLVEPSIRGGTLEFAVVGAGLNLLQTEEDWRRAGLEGRATSCRAEGLELTPAVAAAMWIGEFDALYTPEPPDAAVRAGWQAAWTARGGSGGMPDWR